MQPDRIVVQARERVRLDVFLTRRLAHVSRNRIQRHIERGDVLVDGRTVRPSHLLYGGETILLPPMTARGLEQASEPLDLHIVFEDQDLVVVDKSAGVLVHPVGGEFRRTLLNGLHRHLTERGEDPSELGIVHRLDRLTSGLIAVAKRLEARRLLSLAVEERRVGRTYLAITAGRVEPQRGSIDLYIRRDPARPTRMQTLDAEAANQARQALQARVSQSGYSNPRLDLRPRRARTHWSVLRYLPGATLLRVELETGRTHQIRVHMQGFSHPLIGDPLYGPTPESGSTDRLTELGRSLARPALHAARLSFAHPRTAKPLQFTAPLPADLQQLIRALASGDS